METKIIEATNGPFNWGKFLVGRLDHEWQVRSSVDTISTRSLLQQIGWSGRDIWVLDLQTAEGAAFPPGGLARADLNKHRVWVCPLFEPFLEWLYQQDLTNLSDLPTHINLPDAKFSMSGYRRPGPITNRKRGLRSWRRVRTLIELRNRISAKRHA